MTPFEEELKKALARREPGDEFVRQVLAKVERTKPAASVTREPLVWGSAWWRFASAVVLLAAVLISGLAYRQHERVVKGEAAKNQLLLAMRITGSQLRQAQLRVKKIESTEVVQ
jgi:anti-sigma-K factor RskA